MNIVIIEDEPLNATLLTEFIRRYQSDSFIKATLASKDEIRAYFAEHPQPDLVFCDIELLDGNVFSLLNENMITAPIIFTTAYNQFYQQAFDVNGIAYLLKPVSYDRFEMAMKKFAALSSTVPAVDWRAIAVAASQPQTSYKERLVIKNQHGIKVLPVSELVAVSSNSGILTAIDCRSNTHEFRSKLSDLASELNPKDFFQINRGEIVSIHYIEQIEPYFGDRLAIKIKHLEKRLITSASQTPAFRTWLSQ